MDYLNKLVEFQKSHDLVFKDIDLLKKAFTHSSYANEHNVDCNERLEFLGDAVLQIAVSEFLFENFPNEDEGFLSKKRAKNVCESALCVIAKKMNLGDYLLLGRGEEQSNGDKKCSTLSNTFEALLGAIYLDRGFNEIFKILDRYLFTQLLDDQFEVERDYKSSFQEYVQSDTKRSIDYRLISETGPAHNKFFEIAVYMDEIRMGVGRGKTKKEAEQNSAREALTKLASK
ncbi:ribonuclease III [Mycoplasmatota bacterium zrk1]